MEETRTVNSGVGDDSNPVITDLNSRLAMLEALVSDLRTRVSNHEASYP